MENNEKPIVFECDRDSLIGILHQNNASSTYAVVLIVGGPQYRVGSHRQFVYIARFLAKNNIPVFRFDYRGMGDSQGVAHTFENVSMDIRAAVNQIAIARPDIKHIILWGLCDAASAACFYAATDDRIKGLVLINPWIRTEQGQAKTLLTHYYLQRFFSLDLWLQIFSRRIKIRESYISLIKNIFSSLPLKKNMPSVENKIKNGEDNVLGYKIGGLQYDLPTRVRKGLDVFKGRVLIMLSEHDLTASEFSHVSNNDKKWRKLLKSKKIEKKLIKEADHTFSTEKWRLAICNETIRWIRSF